MMMNCLALPSALCLKELGIVALADGTHGLAILPAAKGQIINAAVAVGEVQNCLLKCLGFLHNMVIVDD